LVVHDLRRSVGFLPGSHAGERYASNHPTAEEQASAHRVRPALHIG
jgi:hypothetical protein